MEIWAKLFEVEGCQLLIEKAIAWNEEEDQDMPAIIFRSRVGTVEMESTAFFNTESIRDKAFSEIDEKRVDEVAPAYLADMIKLGRKLNTEDEN